MESFYEIWSRSKVLLYYRRLAIWSHIIFPLRDILRKQRNQWCYKSGTFPRKSVSIGRFYARDVKLSAFNLIAEANLHLFINLADNKKVLWYNYIMLPLIPLITLGHLLVPLFVTVIVFHNWYIVTVVLLLPFSDFLTLSLIQGLFSWTQETPYKVGGLAALFFTHFLNLPSFCQSVNDPLTPMSDQDRISPYNINQMSD